MTTSRSDEGSFHALGNLGTWSHEASAQQQYVGDAEHLGTRSESSNTDELQFSNLQNPSDALGILARVAGETSSNEEVGNGNGQHRGSVQSLGATRMSMSAPSLSFSYPLLD